MIDFQMTQVTRSDEGKVMIAMHAVKEAGGAAEMIDVAVCDDDAARVLVKGLQAVLGE